MCRKRTLNCPFVCKEIISKKKIFRNKTYCIQICRPLKALSFQALSSPSAFHFRRLFSLHCVHPRPALTYMRKSKRLITIRFRKWAVATHHRADEAQQINGALQHGVKYEVSTHTGRSCLPVRSHTVM